MWRKWIGSWIASCALLVVLPVACSGSGASPSSSQPAAAAGTPALGSPLEAPEALAFDASGNLYVSEFLGSVVDRIDSTGSLTVVAGTGAQGFSGDGGSAIGAHLNMPTGLLVHEDSDLVIADHRNHCIRTVDTAGLIKTLAGTCTKRGAKGDGGPATKARLNDPIGITQGIDGSLYIADEQNALVRVIDPYGTIATFAGGGKTPVAGAPDGTLATRLRLSHPSYVVADGIGNVYISDFLANVVIRVDRAGRITRIAGTGTASFSGDGGPATSATLDFPTGLALDERGRLFISDANNNRVRMVDERGTITTVAGTGPVGVGTGTYGGDGGTADAAHLNAPAGLVVDPRGNLLIADQGNNCVRMLTPSGRITLVAGTP